MGNRNLLNSIKLTKPGKNVFDLSHDVKLSLDMGDLVPILCMEAVPGDKFNISCESLLRFAPLVSPTMHRFDVTMHYFFVPNRILWNNWEKWIVNEGSHTFPFVELDGHPGDEKLTDYLGLPDVNSGLSRHVSALPFAAYHKIYNEYYRDQNLITASTASELVDGDNTNSSMFALHKRAWEHDYFTAALPFAQKGAPVEIPITGTIESVQPGDPGFPIQAGIWRQANTGATSGTGSVDSTAGQSNVAGVGNYYDPNGSLIINNGESTINDLRRAYRLQAWLEKNARAGTRYVENILAHFGVKSSDARLQRPEYITGTKSPVVISEVLNTTGTDDLPQGNMAGHGVSITSGQYGSYFCEEHGYIIGIMSVLPKTAYQQGIPKHFLKTEDPFQYFWPEFANIGEQEILQKELFVNTTTPDATFGYVPRYAEYKYAPSRVAGDFKTSLDFWHMGRIFATDPALNQSFVECTPGKRIFAVEDETNSLYAHVLNKVMAVRPMPKFGTPTF